MVNTQQASEIADFLVGFNYRPLESSALMSCAILNLKERNILFFERNIWENRNPADAKIIDLQMNMAITHYFNANFRPK